MTTDPKDATSFFRKVVKFVANPATEWHDLGAPTPEVRETEFAKAELKAMIERKRRNDFVRKREFDVLRKVRREGLSPEQLAALGGASSRMGDSEGRLPDSNLRQDSGVKAKIDEIEQQMAGETLPSEGRRGAEFFNARTQPASLEQRAYRSTVSGTSSRGGLVMDSEELSLSAPVGVPNVAVMGTGMSPLSGVGGSSGGVGAVGSVGGAPTLPLSSAVLRSHAGNAVPLTAAPTPVELEVKHDPDLDEAVIAFANADFDACEQSLTGLTAAGGSRVQHAETWLVLFDLYRAIGQQHRFESLALDYAQQFGWSAPQWYSMPKMVAEVASLERPSGARIDGQIGWACPEYIDADVVASLRAQTLQMPMPWVFDWTALRAVDPEACASLSALFRHWIPQDIDMRWLAGDRLFAALTDASPTGLRDVDPLYWHLRMDALRMTNRPDQFDETAIDYCVTYEVSPPSWEKARCKVRVSHTGLSTNAPSGSVISEISSHFAESHLTDDAGQVQTAGVELSGQLVGDISEILKRMDTQLGLASFVNVSCTRLIRVDFIAAGDLLNWVLARRSENRSVSFTDAHRLVALFFGAMGIHEHAKVKVKTV
jgi:hypothetical protein